MTKKELKDSGVKAEKQVSELEEIGCVVLELGYFIDFLGKGFQDPLSVVLSLTGDEQEEERVDICCVVLELGYFIDFLGKGFQDPLSVVLSLTGEEQEEERVDISINEMLEEYVWSKD
ncbi:putative uncharacterized protein [Roseburia sp. CAG:471]|nr:putative uncharacterized protein [Roseburia sp. CAG:471]